MESGSDSEILNARAGRGPVQAMKKENVTQKFFGQNSTSGESRCISSMYYWHGQIITKVPIYGQNAL